MKVREFAQRFVQLAVVVVLVAIPATGLLIPPSSESTWADPGEELPNPSVASVAELLGANLSASADPKALSSAEAILASGTVANNFDGPPFYFFGDVNADGRTDLSDFTIIKNNMGLVGLNATRTRGDLTGDRIVGLDDFAIMKFFFGSTSPFLP